MIINTNVSALFAQNSLTQTQNTLQTLQQEMSTGYQINSPADNPSGLAIANLMQGELGGINSAISNANEGANLLNTANGGAQTDMQIVQQIQQLAVQASNSTNNTQDTQDIQTQIASLLKSLDNVSQTLNYNGQAVLGSGPTATLTGGAGTIASVQLGADSGALTIPTGSANSYTVSVTYSTVSGSGYDFVSIVGAAGTVASGTIANMPTSGTVTLQLVNNQTGITDTAGASFAIAVNQSSLTANAGTTVSSTFTINAGSDYQLQTGPNQSNGNTMSISFGNFTTKSLGLNNINVTTLAGAQYAITQAQNALSMLTNAQGQIGANLDQINYTITNLQTESVNLQASRSTIMDANMAVVTSQFAQQQVLLQTGLQSLQTANSLPGMVLKLLG